MTLFVLFDPGELEVVAEFRTKDSEAAGSVDFVVLLNSFVISVLEVRMLCCHSDASVLYIVSILLKAFCGNRRIHNNRYTPSEGRPEGRPD